MIGVAVSITRYVSDEPQPGVVECELMDAHGRCWRFVEKTAIVSAEPLDASFAYPRSGIIACEILGRSLDGAGREVVQIDTRTPWAVESLEGRTQFEVHAACLIRWEEARRDASA
jgi:hypothetical protein